MIGSRTTGTLLVAAALAAAALAAPNAAPALTLKDAGAEVKDKDFGEVGTFRFSTDKQKSVVSCPLSYYFTIDGQTVTVPSAQLTTGMCTTSGRFAKCTITKYNLEDLPWPVTVDAKELTIEDVTTKLIFGSAAGQTCPYKSWKTHHDPWIAKPDDPKKIKKFSYSAVGGSGILEPTASGSPLSLEGTDSAGASSALTAFGAELKCADSSYDGELKEATKSVTFTPTFNNSACQGIESGAAHKATVTANGCSLVLHVGGGSEQTWAGTGDLICPAGKALEAHVYLSETSETLKVCTFKVNEQKGLSGLTITNDLESGDIRIEGSLTGVSVERSGLCGVKSTSEGKYDLNVTVKGVGSGGAEVIEVSEAGLLTALPAEIEMGAEASDETEIEGKDPTYEIA
jgi:hypothetical protein